MPSSLELPAILNEETRELARIIAAPDCLNDVREILPDDRAFVCPEVARLWNHIRIVADKGLPLSQTTLGESVGDDTQAALVLSDALSVAATMTGPGVARSAVRNARLMVAAMEARESAEHCESGTCEPPTQLPDVPLDALPVPLGDYCRAVSANMEAPLPLVFGAMLATASAVVPSGALIMGRPGYKEIAPLWLAVVAEPGSKKSPTIARITQPLNACDANMNAAHLAALETWKANCAAITAQAKKGARPVLPPEPKRPQLIVDDCTVEALADVLSANEPHGLGLLSCPDELTALVGGFNSYRAKGKGADRQRYLSLWSGGPVRVDRRERHVLVSRPRLSLLGGIQPSVAMRLQTLDEHDGLLDRLHWLDCREENAPRFDVPAVPPALESAWGAALRALIPDITPADLLPDTSEAAPDVDARVYELAPDAVPIYAEFYERCDRRDDSPIMRGYVGKLPGQCLRVALTLHHLRHGRDVFQNLQVDAQTVRAAVTVAEWLGAHTSRSRSDMAGVFTGSRDASKLLAFIRKRGGSCYLREIVTGGPQSCRSTSAAREACDELVNAGKAEWAEQTTAAGRERESVRLLE